MSTQHRTAVSLGDLIITTFDVAAEYASDPRKISRLATSAIGDMLRRAWPMVRLVTPRRALVLTGGAGPGLVGSSAVWWVWVPAV